MQLTKKELEQIKNSKCKGVHATIDSIFTCETCTLLLNSNYEGRILDLVDNAQHMTRGDIEAAAQAIVLDMTREQ